MKYSWVLFDLDGTLTDPGIGITNSVMYALNKYGIKETNRSALYKFIGPPLRDSFMNYYGLSEEEAWKCVELYREYFGVKGLFENQVYEGISQLLERIKAAGIGLLVATSKPTEYSIRILEKFDLLKYFDYVSGSEMNEGNADKGTIIKNALEWANADRDKVLMVGDRCFDVIGAKANGVDSVGVLYGYGDQKELEEAGATYICQRVEDIAECIFSGR